MGKPAGKFEWATDYFSYLNVYSLLVFGIYIPYSYKPDERPRWNALYYTGDPAAGSPLMLDSNGECFKVQYNNSTVPAGKKALTTFGEAVPANMNSYVSEKNADSIYVYYTTEQTKARINQPTQNTSSEKECVKSVMLCCAESETEAKTTLKRAGCNVIDTNLYNLNEGLFSFKSNTKFLTDSRAYLFCRRQSNPDNYIKPGAAIVGGHCESSITYGDLYIEPAS